MQAFLSKHQLPPSYADTARRSFDPVANQLIALKKQQCNPLVIGLNGAQGSGKTTLADYLCYYLEHEGFRCLSMSLDDFYLSKAERIALSETVHPLLRTRGVPGTHDIALLKDTFANLIASQPGTRIPHFDKAIDDQVPEHEWHIVDQDYDFIIFEGWCWGAIHQDSLKLTDPVNELEREEDEEGIWRQYVNDQLKVLYEPLYSLMDVWLMLKAPSFDAVYKWRLEQEQKLEANHTDSINTEIMSAQQITRFIKYFERITTSILNTLPNTADLIWVLDQKRSITGIRTNGGKLDE